VRDALIIPTYGFITHENTPGGRGTKARIAKAAELIREGIVARNCLVDFPQGEYARGRDSMLLGVVILGKNVADYVRTLPEFSEADVTFPFTGYGSRGTFDDTIASLNGVYPDVDDEDKVRHIHFVSDWSQLGRLWLIWHIAWKHHVKKLGWKASFHLVPNFRTLRDVWLHEPPAYLKCLWNCFRWRFFAV
jgi:hypothetical protein